MIVDSDMMAMVMSTSAGFGADTAAAFRTVDPDDPALWRPLGSGALVSWGAGRYVNRAIGVSLDALGDGELDELEAFFDDRGIAPSIEVLSWASPDLVARLVARRFVPIRTNDLLVVAPSRTDGTRGSIDIRLVDDATASRWSDAFVVGFSTTPEDELLNRELTTIVRHVPHSVHLLAEIGGAVAGCGSLYPQGRVGWIGGGATLPAFRRRGVQAALLDARVASAHRLGCTVVAATAVAGSQSSRNMQRRGFTLAATILVMTRTP